MAKRLFDVVVALAASLAAAPVLVAAAAAVKLGSRGPVLHRSRRLGRHGAEFELLKFRTMVRGAERLGPAVTRSGDPRVTRVGRVLRATKADELPQLLNVLRGDMSIVGPRPEAPRFAAHYAGEHRRVLDVRPGITSPTAVAFRHEERLLAAIGGDPDEAYATRLLPQKLALDLAYVERASLAEDVRVIVRTARALLARPRRSPG